MLSAIMQFTGVPAWPPAALSVPVGFDADGLPVGMQVIGAFDEATLFRLGHAYQQRPTGTLGLPACDRGHTAR